MSKEILNFIDVFSGAGGLSCGLELAGFRCLLGIDMNKHAIETFAHNHKHAETFCGDIRQLTAKELKRLVSNQRVHVVVGGPPCQGFSTVGAGNPNDSRNTLFLEFCRMVKLTDPEFIVMENVTGLLAQKNEKTLRAILTKFATLGYTMDVRVLSAQEHGVPERRRRTIFIGAKNRDSIAFPTPITDTESRPAVTVGDVLLALSKEKKLENHDIEKATPKSKIDIDRLKHIPEGKGIRYEADDLSLPSALRMGVDWDALPEHRFRQTKYQRLDRKRPSPTIMTSGTTYYHPTENRLLTAREAAALQSFPNHFVFKGTLQSQWRQIGNAVPPLLGKAIGKALLAMRSSKAKTINTSSKASIEKTVGQIRKKAFVYN